MRMRVLLFPIALLIAIASSAKPAPRQQTGPDSGSAKLVSIKVTGSERFRSDQIASAVGLTPGKTITKNDLQQVANQLAQYGPFSNVEYRYGSTDAGVEAEYRVADAPSLPVFFDNFPWFKDDELVASLKTAVPLFDGRAPEQGAMLDDISHELQSLITKHGVVAAVAHSVITAPAADEKVQKFHIEDFPMPVDGVIFTDPLAQDDRGIQSRLKDILSQNYSRTTLELFAIEQVRPVYVSHAYLNVQFGEPKAQVEGAAASPKVAVTMPIEPGPVFKWDGVNWSGDKLLGVLQLETMIPLHVGDPADGMKVEKGWQSVRDTYANHGYLSANLDIKPQFDQQAHTVKYNVAISEGSQFRMGKLVLTGLSIEGERRIRAAWRIPPGEVFDKSIFDEFMATGIKNAFMGMPAHYEKVGSFLQENSGTDVVDVLIDFQ
jgi:outer membrane protein assembly factor BamA